jgi:hypothetical protein
MSNVITLKPILDVKYLYTVDIKDLLEIILPFNQKIDDRVLWFQKLANLISTEHHKTTTSKIHNIFYGTSKVTSMERDYLERIARKKIQSLPDPRQATFYLRGAKKV